LFPHELPPPEQSKVVVPELPLTVNMVQVFDPVQLTWHS
jgi:hypothetical protein